MTRRALLAAILCVTSTIAAVAAEREWQKGTWRDEKIERPRVLFGAQPRNPNDNVPRSAVPPREIRTFVIDTNTHRLELRQDATADTPRIEVLIGEPVSIAIEKKTVYLKDTLGKEHKLTLRKQTPLER
jgi:hypothetical protein